MKPRIYYTKPSITELEVKYATDAARNGWGNRCYEYISRFEEASALYRKAGMPVGIVLPTCRLAECSPGEVAKALSALGEYEGRLECGERIEARYSLWKATGKPEHLCEAKRLLDYRVEHAPEEYRESMLKNVRLNREIMVACAEHGEKAVGEGDAD